jgi:DNA-binding transcriptional LysR family regulator
MSAPTLQHLTPRLKLRHFALLAELERQRSVSRAAEHLGLSQPTVTRALGEIENIFMTPLFTRSRRGLEPTPAGLLVLARARVALADAQSLGQDLAALGTGLQGRLRIGVLPFLARATQDAVWQHLLAVRPRLGFVVEEATTHVLVQAVRARTLDCAICRFTSASAEAGLAQEFLYTQEPRLVVSRAAAQRLARHEEAHDDHHQRRRPSCPPIRVSHCSICCASTCTCSAPRRAATRAPAARAPCSSMASASCPAWRWPCNTRAARSPRSKAWRPQWRAASLQQAFVEHDGFQCGYCTPGQICSAVGMARRVAARRAQPRHADLSAQPSRSAATNCASA